MKAPCPRIQQPRVQAPSIVEEQDLETTPDCFVGFIGVDPHEPLVLHGVDD